MAANKEPIYTGVPRNPSSIWTSSLTANTKSDGTGTIATDMVVAITANATNGSFVNRMRFAGCASVAATGMTASVIRIYKSTVSSGATARADTNLIMEVATPNTAVDNATFAGNMLEVPLGFALGPGESLLWSMHHAAAANTSWSNTTFAGDY